MRAKLSLLSAFAAGLVGGAAVSGCQTYDFEPVAPLALAQTTVGDTVTAQALKPNLMVLLDTSGSMTLPVNTRDPDCFRANSTPSPDDDYCGQTPATACNTAVCPTRWSELQGAMSRFLSENGSVARMGLTTYPGPAAGANSLRCEASSVVNKTIPQSDDDPSLQAAASGIQSVILGIPNAGTNAPSGGTPTSLSLQFVGQQPDVQATDRDNFVLLLTDGLPNCNPENANSGTNVDACQCTLANIGANTGCQGDYVRRGCLDKDASVVAVEDLKKKGIRTIVVGFGAETATGNGPATLNAMATAGDFARSCRDDPNACGAGDTCDATTKLCGRRFYQAANQEELANALKEIIDLVGSKDICLLALAPEQLPTDNNANLVVVYVNDQITASGADTWSLTDKGVQFAGATCERIKNSTPANPIKLEVRAVQKK
ncbi:adventurous gliding motility lipoprotein CglB [Stigmatella hybrida]|uniref:adventurous gliding motility lipoprotein CglB n=1 Tax=Stigmatella hybrida TaxID=394097 RepID=UPI001CDA60DB|nr:adventurous gliding motility lipoprotein CglB [Stigmatella hybrida]